MVSNRCKMLVKDELAKLGIAFSTIDLGQVILKNPLSILQRESLHLALIQSGLELMEDKKAIII